MTDTTVPTDADILAAVMTPDLAIEPEGRRNRDALFDYDLPAIVRGFIAIMDMPATQTMAVREADYMPKLYATWTPPPNTIYGKDPIRVRVVMVSRLGDVGISRQDKEYGYFTRVSIYDLTDFGTEMDPKVEPPKGRRYYAVADKFGSWVHVTPREIKGAKAPVLYDQRADAWRVIEKKDRHGILGLQVVSVRVIKEKP